jgi:hypothetical protein
LSRQAADAVDGLVGKLNGTASNFDRGRWKRFDLFKVALDILKDQGLDTSDTVLAEADFSDLFTADEFWKAVAAWRPNMTMRSSLGSGPRCREDPPIWLRSVE